MSTQITTVNDQSAAAATTNCFCPKLIDRLDYSTRLPAWRANEGELSDQSNRELNASKLLTAMGKLKMDFGLEVDDILELSDRDGVLLALHLFQVKIIYLLKKCDVL